jgi:peptide/nickel transport system substrate-binding protein
MATIPHPDADRSDTPGPIIGRHITRREMLRLSGSVASLAAVQALLTACGGSSNGATAPAKPPAGTAAPAPTSAGASTTAGGSASGTTTAGSGNAAAKLVNGGGTPPTAPTGELRVGTSADFMSLDPIDTYSLNNGRWQENVFSPLIWRDQNLVVYDGKEGRPAPADGYGLAESFQYVDDKTLELKLRKGITFHNGEPFNAASVKSTFTRMLDKANKSPQASNYTAIDSVQTVDDYTVRLLFNAVDPVMITKLCGYGGFITPAGATQDHTKFATTDAPGTGPYKVTKYAKDDRLVLDAWDGWWGKKKPLIKTITYRVIPDDNTRLSEFLAGNIDVLTLNVSQANAAKGNPKVQVVSLGVPTVSGLRLDAKKAPTDKREVRLAIAYAIDQKTIIDTILSGNGKAVGIWQSPFSFGYEDDLPPYPYDPAKAKTTLAAAGVQTPVKLVYDVDGTNTQDKEIANAVKTMLDAVGFSVDIHLAEHATFFDDYRAGKLGNIVPFGWGGWTLDFDNTYYLMHYTGQSYNPSYSNPQVDTLLDQQRGTLDQTKRLGIAKQINKILHDDAIDVAMYQQTYLWGVSSHVANFLIPPDERLWWLEAYTKG